MIKIIIPSHGDKSENLNSLIRSLDNQIYSNSIEVFFCEDVLSPNFKKNLKNICRGNKVFFENKFKKRSYALKNINACISTLSTSDIVGIIDCDDFLWGNDCIKNVLKEYEKGADCVWTANSLIGTGINYSASLNHEISVYKHPWVSSHFKTFKVSDFNKINKSNFKDDSNEWFKSCYDQALMLPIINNILERNGTCKYIDKVHYIYNKEDPSKPSKYRSDQLNNEKIIRNRGYLK